MAVWVTGTGCITCVGPSVDRLWQAALQEKSGIRNGLGSIPDIGDVPAGTRPLEFARVAIREAISKAGWTSLSPRDGLILATTTGQIPAWDKAMIAFLDGKLDMASFGEAFQHQPLGDLLSRIANDLHFYGEQTVVTSACAAGTQALALAALWMETGRAERCLVGGVEVLCDLTVQGFRSLQLLSPEPTRPFDVRRKGINLSEGAAFICLEKKPRALGLAEQAPDARREEEGVPFECTSTTQQSRWPFSTSPVRLSGYGMTSDGHHMTAPHPEGRGSFEAMRMALETAALEASEIDWVHAHGTGSIHNDSAEAAAIKTLFGGQPWVSSTKHIHGHALGAAGLIESTLVIEALKNQIVLRTSGLESPDPAMGLRFPAEHTSTRIRHVMKNTLGFGGTNAAVIFSREDA